MKSIIKFLVLVSTFCVVHLASAQVVVVVNAKSPVAKLNKDQVASLFLGKSSQLPGAGIPVLVDQPEAAEIRQMFYTKVTEKTPVQVKAIWSRLVFSGKGTLPKEVSNSEEVKKLLATNPDAVGYIDKSAVDASVKVILAVD